MLGSVVKLFSYLLFALIVLNCTRRPSSQQLEILEKEKVHADAAEMEVLTLQHEVQKLEEMLSLEKAAVVNLENELEALEMNLKK